MTLEARLRIARDVLGATSRLTESIALTAILEVEAGRRTSRASRRTSRGRPPTPRRCGSRSPGVLNVGGAGIGS